MSMPPSKTPQTQQGPRICVKANDYCCLMTERKSKICLGAPAVVLMSMSRSLLRLSNFSVGASPRPEAVMILWTFSESSPPEFTTAVGDVSLDMTACSCSGGVLSVSRHSFLSGFAYMSSLGDLGSQRGRPGGLCVSSGKFVIPTMTSEVTKIHTTRVA